MVGGMSSPSPHPRSTKRQYWSVLACALLFLAGNLGAFAHRLMEPHHWCELHGQFEHAAGELANDRLADGDVRSDQHSGPALHATTASEHAGNHDGCQLGDPRTPHATVVLEPTTFATHFVAHARSRFARATERAREALYLLAPKNSPPPLAA